MMQRTGNRVPDMPRYFTRSYNVYISIPVTWPRSGAQWQCNGRPSAKGAHGPVGRYGQGCQFVGFQASVRSWQTTSEREMEETTTRTG